MLDMTGYSLISADSHVIEPPDLFSARLPTKLRDRAPRLATASGTCRWSVGSESAPLPDSVVNGSGWRRPPHGPRSFEDVLPALYDPSQRLLAQDADGVAAESTPTAPINPYGTSKLMSEWMLASVAQSSSLRYAALRYFNVAGSDSGGRIGQATPNATLLIKVACEAAVGKRAHVSIFGTDYPTADGTGVRDYIHVEDLATAHVDALSYLRGGGDSTTLNVGYGHGYSVRQVLESVERISGQRLSVREEPRRAGDPPALVARAERIRRELGWRPRLNDLDTIVRTAYAWEQHLQREPW